MPGRLNPSRRMFLGGAGAAALSITALETAAVGGAQAAQASGQAATGQTKDLGEITDPNAPSWVKDLIIYEVNPRGFTSPNGVGDGNGSGTFASMDAQLGYLQKLGITGIWLAGYCKATNHFFNIWSVYATVDPSQLDPVLGTPADFKKLVDDAHARGIRIFLDVISHGVVNSSPLIAEHPDWFEHDANGNLTGSFEMTDYDWSNLSMRQWWLSVWTNYVTQYAIDGFRVDVSLQRVDVWDQIVANAREAGHPIAVFGESAPYDFSEADYQLTKSGQNWSVDMGNDWASQTRRYATITVSTHDNGYGAPPGNYYAIRGSRAAFGVALLSGEIPLFFGGEEFNDDQVGLPNLQAGLYGGGGPGGWLYGSQLQWQEITSPANAAMLADVTKLIGIRKSNADVLNADRTSGGQFDVPVSPGDSLVPYVRYKTGSKGIIVVPNAGTSDANYTLQMPLGSMGIAGHGSYLVTDLWNGQAAKVVAELDLANWEVTVPADQQAGGGIGVYEIKPADSRPTLMVDDTDPSISYSPNVTLYYQPLHYNGTVHASSEPGGTAGLSPINSRALASRCSPRQTSTPRTCLSISTVQWLQLLTSSKLLMASNILSTLFSRNWVLPPADTPSRLSPRA